MNTINQQNNMMVSLLRLNFRWHRQVMKDIFMQYKIIVLFFFLILAPSLSSIYYTMNLLVTNLIAYQSTAMTLCLSLIGYQILGTLWMAVNYQVFFKQDWENYILSLAMTAKEKSRTEIFIISYIDLVLWVPMILIMGIEIINSQEILHAFLVVEATLINLMLMMLIQLSMVKKKYGVLLFILIVDGLMILQVAFLSLLVRVSIYGILIIMAWLQFKRIYKKNDINISKFSMINSKPNFTEKLYYQRLVYLKIQFKNLIVGNFSQISLMASFLILNIIFSICYIAQAANNENLLLIISSILLINALILSHLFVNLSRQRKSFSSYLMSLAITQKEIVTIDLLIASFFLVGCHCVMMYAATLYLSEAYFLRLLITGLIAIILLIIIYFPQIKYKRYGFLIAFMIMCLFIWINYLLLN